MARPVATQAGEWFAEMREKYPHMKAHDLADLCPWSTFAPEPSVSMVDETIRERQTELNQRAADGDKFAISLLEGKYAGEDPT